MDRARTSLVTKMECARSREWSDSLPPRIPVLARYSGGGGVVVKCSSSVWPSLELPNCTIWFSLLVADLPLSFKPVQQEW